MRFQFKFLMLVCLILILLLPATLLVSQDNPPPAEATQAAQLNMAATQYAVQSEQLDSAAAQIAEQSEQLNMAATQIADLQTENAALKATLTAIAPREIVSEAPSDLTYRTVTTEDFEMSLPERFEGGDIKTSLATMLPTLRAMGPQYQSIANTIEQNPQLFRLFAVDTELNDGVITNVNVIVEATSLDVSIEDYVELGKRQLPPALKIVGQENVKIGDYDAIQVLIEWEVAPGVVVKEVQYAFKFGTRYVSITFTTSESGFESWLPEFEYMASTFKWLSE